MKKAIITIAALAVSIVVFVGIGSICLDIIETPGIFSKNTDIDFIVSLSLVYTLIVLIVAIVFGIMKNTLKAIGIWDKLMKF